MLLARGHGCRPIATLVPARLIRIECQARLTMSREHYVISQPWARLRLHILDLRSSVARTENFEQRDRQTIEMKQSAASRRCSDCLGSQRRSLQFCYPTRQTVATQ